MHVFAVKVEKWCLCLLNLHHLLLQRHPLNHLPPLLLTLPSLLKGQCLQCFFSCCSLLALSFHLLLLLHRSRDHRLEDCWLHLDHIHLHHHSKGNTKEVSRVFGQISSKMKGREFSIFIIFSDTYTCTYVV